MISEIAIALGLVPIAQFILIYFLSLHGERHNDLKKNYAILYLDWVFLPFNLMFIYAVDIEFNTFLICGFVGLTISALAHQGIHMMSENKSKSLFRKGKGPTFEAIVHYIFMSIEVTLVTYVFLAQPISKLYFWMMLVLLIYPLWSLYVTLFIYRKKRKTWKKHEFNWGEVAGNSLFALAIIVKLMMIK